MAARTPRMLAATPFSRASQALRLSAPVRSVLENAAWNHLVVKPESGSAGMYASLNAKITSTTSGT
jgi:hypothetical protein